VFEDCFLFIGRLSSSNYSSSNSSSMSFKSIFSRF